MEEEVGEEKKDAPIINRDENNQILPNKENNNKKDIDFQLVEINIKWEQQYIFV